MGRIIVQMIMNKFFFSEIFEYYSGVLVCASGTLVLLNCGLTHWSIRILAGEGSNSTGVHVRSEQALRFHIVHFDLLGASSGHAHHLPEVKAITINNINNF